MKKKALKASHRAHVFYSGRVQGVGFRYTVERIALDLRLVGWVKNLPDGRVELVCEGGKEDLSSLLTQIQGSFPAEFLKKVACRWEPPTGLFYDFSVEFHL